MIIQNYLAEPVLQNYLSPSYPIFIQIKSLLGSITNKKTMRSAKSDIINLVEKVGPEGQKFLLCSLLQNMDIKQLKDKSQTSSRVAFLGQLIKENSLNQSFLNYFPQVIAQTTESSKAQEFIHALFQYLKIPSQNQVAIALSLYLSGKQHLSQIGERELEKRLIQFKQSNKDVQLPEKILEELLFQIRRSPQLLNRLQAEYDYLIDRSEKIDKVQQAKVYNYLKGDWQYFANQQIVLEKPPLISIKKVDILRDVGPTATLNLENLKFILNQFGPMTQEDVFQCLLMIAEDKQHLDTGIQKFLADVFIGTKKNLKGEQLKKLYTADISNKKSQTSWNIDNFITFCIQNVQNIRWPNVMNYFDRPKLQFSSEDSFLNMMRYFQKAKKQGPKFKTPQNTFFKKWNHPISQANFLFQVFRCKQPQVLGIHQINNRKIQKSVKDVNIMSKQIWGHLDLVQILIQLSDYKYVEIRELFEVPIMKHPELLIQTLAEIKPAKGQAMLDEIFSQLFPIYLHNHSNYIKLLQNLWETNQDLVISTICELYKSDSKKDNSINLSRVLDIAQILKESLIPLTNWNDYEFAVPLAILAGKREFLHFQPWIADRIKNAGNPFLRSVLNYIQDNLLGPIRMAIKSNQAISYENYLEKAQLSKQLLAFIFESIFLTTSSSKMSKRNFQNLKRVYKQVCQYYPQLSDSQMPDQIEQKSERQFSKIYRRQITVQEAVKRMQALKTSRKQEQTQQFASMITFMFSELRFHLDYPEKELMTTAQLFAGVVNANLIERKLFNVLLQVLEYDLKQDNCKYMFAVSVVQNIKEKLSSEPQFCDKLIDNELVMSKDPQMVDELLKNVKPPLNLSVQREKKIIDAIKIKNSPPQPIVTNPVLEEDVPVETLKKVELNDIDILLALDKTKRIVFNEKDSKLSKINTLCNTLSTNNVYDKAKDLKIILDTQNSIKLIAYNIVFKRIPLAQGSNGTQVFYQLLQRIPSIQKPILNITYKILNSWFALTNKSPVNDKKLNHFKNLGHWLGRLTISKGMPVPIHKLNLREILINSYTQNNSVRIPMNVPVVLKILEHINNHPDVFKVTNPWLGKLLGTLNEIEQKLKQEHQSTKSEIKAFFRSTEMRRQSFNIPSTTYLSNSQIPLISQLPRYIKINEDQHEHYMNQGIDLKVIITKAVDDSIQQIVQPVIDRAVKIAIVTTKQLIIKDFAYENDVQKFQNSCYNVVKRLAGPLAQVTCRQPLKASMNRILKNYLSQNIKDQAQIDNIITRAIPDNLDLGCALIKKAVIQSAQESIRKDSIINESIDLRNRARLNGEQFRDQEFIRQIPSIVPQELRPKPGGLSFEEFLVYDSFKKEKPVNIQCEKDEKTNAEKVAHWFNQRYSGKQFKQIIINDLTIKEEILRKLSYSLARQIADQSDSDYLLEVCEELTSVFGQSEAWNAFRQYADLSNKQTCALVRRLVRQKYFDQKSLSELEQGNQQQNKAIIIFEKWLDTAHEEIEPFLQKLEQIFNKSENQIKLFFEYSLNYTLNKVAQSVDSYDQSMDTTYIEDYSKLIIISLKLISSNNCILYLEHTTQAILQVFNRLQSCDSKISYQRPFFKLFLNFICDATRKEYSFDQLKIMTFYCVLARVFHKINPNLCPNFAFAWVELISNKYFISTLLQNEEYWDVYFELICDLLKFAKEHLTEDNLKSKPYQVFYKGILRLNVILIHDFPDFLSQFSLQLCLQTPDIFIQIRNMITSAYPKDLKFPKPQTIINRDFLEKEPSSSLIPKYFNLKFDNTKFNQLIASIQTGDKSLKNKIEAQNQESLQQFVLYLAWPECSHLNPATARKLLIELISTFDGDLRQKLVKYMLNLIRYPNLITVFFIDTVTSIVFRQGHDKVRILLLNRILERMKAEGPHSWGIIYLVNQFQIQKGDLSKFPLPSSIMNQL